MDLLPTTTDAAISQADLDLVAQIAMLRLPLRGPESERTRRLHALLAAGAELSRTLGSHTHCALVNCQGSHGAGDLAAETSALFTALARYAELVRATAREYRRLVESSVLPSDALLAPPAERGMLRVG